MKNLQNFYSVKLKILMLFATALIYGSSIYAQPPGHSDAVYNSTTGTWFKMISQGGNWFNADASAQAMLNTGGWTSRLAVLDNPTLHSFGRTLPGMGAWHIVWIYECDVDNGWKLGGTGYNSIVCQSKNDIQGEFIVEFLPPLPCTDFEEVLDTAICEHNVLIWRGMTCDQAGTYYDSLETTNPPGCDSVYVLNLTVFPLPDVSIQGLDTFYCIYSPVIIMSGIPTGGVFNGNGVSGLMFDPSAAGTGDWVITYTFTDSLACTNHDSVNVHVDECLNVTFSEESYMWIYPVPFHDQILLDIFSFQSSELIWNLFSLDGKIVGKGHISIDNGMNQLNIDTSDLATGTYMFQSSLNGKTQTVVLMKH